MDIRQRHVVDGDSGLRVVRVQRLRPYEGGRVSYTLVDGSGLPIPAAEDYLAHLTSVGRSPNTVRSYAHDLADLFEWLGAGERDFRLLTLEQLGEFFDWLRRPPAARAADVFVLPSVQPAVSGNTLIRKRAAVAGFYRFHTRRDPAVPALLGDSMGPRPSGGYIPMLIHTRRGGVDREAFSPIRLKATHKRPETVTAAEFGALLTACRRARDRFLLMVMHDAGLRLGEALGLRHEDLRLRAGELQVVGRDNNVNGARVKGLKDRIVPVDAVLLDGYADYMESEYGALDCDYVFVNLFRAPVGAAMTADSVKDLSRRLRAATGIEHFHPHVLRHSYATRLLRAGVPMEVVAELLGHASAHTTQTTYSHLTVEDHRRVLVSAGVLTEVAS